MNGLRKKYLKFVMTVLVSVMIFVGLGMSAAVHADELDEKLEAAVEKALECVKPEMSDLEKALVLHDYIVTHVDYSQDTYAGGSTAVSALVYGKADCDGYAKAYTLLLGKVGISSYVVISDIMHHGWNLVYIDGHWYHADLTWDDSLSVDGGVDGIDMGDVNHAYFLYSDDEFNFYLLNSHYGWDSNLPLADNSNAFDGYCFRDAKAELNYYDSYWYYLDGEGNIVKSKIDGSDKTKISFVKDGAVKYLQLFDGKLYYDNVDKIYSYDLTTGENKCCIDISKSYMSHTISEFSVRDGKLNIVLNKINDKKVCEKNIIIDIASLNKTMVFADELTIFREGERASLMVSGVSDEDEFTYTCDDTSVAAVDDNGKVLAVSEGTTNVKVTDAKGNIVAECQIIVDFRYCLKGINIFAERIYIDVIDDYVIPNWEAIGGTGDIYEWDVVWSTSDASVVKIDDMGYPYIVGEGTVTLTVTTKEDGFSDSCEVIVDTDMIRITNVTLNKSEDEIWIEEELQLVANLYPDNVICTDVTWISSDESIAVVDENGKVTPKKTGKVTITVVTVEGQKTAECDVTVIPCEGEGDAEAPYLIGDLEEFYWFVKKVNEKNALDIHVKLISDIVINENLIDGMIASNDENIVGLEKISKFSGVFDGDGHTISGLYFKEEKIVEYLNSENYVGLFGAIGAGGVVKNLRIKDSYFEGDGFFTGAIAGSNEGTIINCHSDAIIYNNSSAGGIVGSNEGIVINCTNSGNVNAKQSLAGGIAGANNGKDAKSGLIVACANSGNVKGDRFVGGIAGGYGIIQNCGNSGNVEGVYGVAGGICGFICDGVSSSSNIGKVNGSIGVGGICGYLYMDASDITNCYYLKDCAASDKGVVNNGIACDGEYEQEADNEDIEGSTMCMTKEQYASGKAAYDMNGPVSAETDIKPVIWGQLIGRDAYPVFGGEAVYNVLSCDGKYDYNNINKAGEHNYDESGICYACGKKEGEAGDIITEYNGIDYSDVYDYAYYIGRYPDIFSGALTSPEEVIKYFVETGMSLGHRASEEFSLEAYKSNYPDLGVAFGSDSIKYYMHYINNGRAEGRNATVILVESETKYYGVDYGDVYNYDYYINNNPDLKAAFGDNKAAALIHFANMGMKEGRQACENFGAKIYKFNYPELQESFGEDMVLYYHHYMDFGKAEGRNGATRDFSAYCEYEGVNYTPVYNYEDYIERNPDVFNAYGLDANAVLKHFVTVGMAEGRQGSDDFNYNIYRSNYPDLETAFGEDRAEYYHHYINSGYDEGRNAATSDYTSDTVYAGIDYADVYNYDYYVTANPDVAAAIGDNKIAILAHFVRNGMAEGRQGSAEFNVGVYMEKNPDLVAEFGSDLKAYYMHYIEEGKETGREAD